MNSNTSCTVTYLFCAELSHLIAGALRGRKGLISSSELWDQEARGRHSQSIYSEHSMLSQEAFKTKNQHIHGPITVTYRH